MRVLEPHHFKYHSTDRSKWPRLIVVCVLLVAVGVGGYWYWGRERTAKNERAKTAWEVQPQVVSGTDTAPKSTPKVFTGMQFRDLYRSVLPTYPNTNAFDEPPHITGNMAADERIRQIAEKRGFQLTRIPVTALTKTNEPLLRGQTDDLLQPLAYDGWLKLKEAAKQDNIPLQLMSAYRSPEWQRGLFIERLGVSAETIAAGFGDAAVQTTLGVTAIPGYSRHHSGYAVDFMCQDGSGSFAASSCFRWLNETNYLNAKLHGWIPSYPEGADMQGPEPEAWEYVWVGRDFLFQ